jgi:uncharacterized membrane protein YfcA
MDTLIQIILDGTGLSFSDLAILSSVSFIASLFTASMGLGGGTLVLATMALILPPTILIPIHAVVQLCSNGGRAALMLKNVTKPIILPFLIGTTIGATVGAQVVISLPTAVLQAVLAVFIFYATWASKFNAKHPSSKTFFGVGLLATFATMFVGATGPLVAPFVSAHCKQRQNFIATHALLMVIQHGLKMIAFGALGFAFGPYIPMLICLISFGFIGTLIGKRVSKRLPEHIFSVGLKVILTLLALRLMYSAASGLA